MRCHSLRWGYLFGLLVVGFGAVCVGGGRALPFGAGALPFPGVAAGFAGAAGAGGGSAAGAAEGAGSGGKAGMGSSHIVRPLSAKVTRNTSINPDPIMPSKSNSSGFSISAIPTPATAGTPGTSSDPRDS